MDTSELLKVLAANAAPVRRLRSPWLRAGLWLLLAFGVMGVLTGIHGLRPQFSERMHETSFFVGMMASMLTGILATIATFQVSLPDRSRKWVLLPIPSLLIWMAQIGYQCFAGWVSLPPGAVTVQAASSCLFTLAVTSIPLTLTMAVMLRYAVFLRPISVALVGSLAVSAFTSVSLAMFHPLDATVMVLGWNLGTAAILVGGAVLFSRKWSRRNAGEV